MASTIAWISWCLCLHKHFIQIQIVYCFILGNLLLLFTHILSKLKKKINLTFCELWLSNRPLPADERLTCFHSRVSTIQLYRIKVCAGACWTCLLPPQLPVGTTLAFEWAVKVAIEAIGFWVLPGRGWHLIYVPTSIWVALVVLRMPYVDRVYRENLGMDWHIFTFRCWFDRAMPFAVRDG